MTAPVLTRDGVTAACSYARDWLEFRRTALRVPGVQAAVRLGGELVLSTAHGVADVGTGTALTPEHVFRVASHSKTFTATAVLRLAERGRLRLDDAVGSHVPWVGQESPELGRATLRELLGHAAGVTRDGRAGDFWILDGEFPDADGLRTAVREGGALIGRSERFKYSNIGYSLLGLVVEAVTGTSYADHVRAEFVEPLGLRRTAADVDAFPDRQEFATGHSSLAVGDQVPLTSPSTRAMAAATGFCSTAEDLTAWFSAHASGRDAVLDAHSRRLAQRAEWTVEGSESTYGLGFIGERCGARDLVGHSGGFPGHITKSVVDVTAGLAVSVLTNAVDGPATELARGLVRIVDLVASEWTVRTDGPDLDPFCGRWANLFGVHDVVRCGSTLVAVDPQATDPGAATVRLDPVDDTTLRVTADGGFGGYAETWTLGRRTDGVPTLRSFSGTTMVPLKDHSVRPGA